MFLVLILEDDLVQSDTIKLLINKYYPDWEVYTAFDYKQANELINKASFNLFLVDIELSEDKNEPTGLDFAKMLRSMSVYRHTPVIFITGIKDKVLSAIQEVHCDSYLIKPYQPDELIDAINYATEDLNENEQEILFRDSHGVYQKLNPADIEYIEVSGKNIMLHTRTYVITIANYSMQRVLEELPDYFIRCHRKYIINVKKVASYDKSTQIIHLGGNEIPVGRKYKHSLERFFRL